MHADRETGHPALLGADSCAPMAAAQDRLAVTQEADIRSNVVVAAQMSAASVLRRNRHQRRSHADSGPIAALAGYCS